MSARTRDLEGWHSVYRRDAGGAITSDESVRIRVPVVRCSDEGARQLGQRYWLAVARASRGLVRSRETGAGVELRVLGRACVLRLGPAQTAFDDDSVRCRYAIEGGLLARRPSGSLTLSETRTELRATVEGFVPRLRGQVYQHLQHRLHVAVSCLYFSALLGEAAQ